MFLQSGEKNSAEFNFSVWPYYPCRPLLWNSLTAVHNTIWKSDLSFVSKSCISNPHEEKRRLKNTPWGTDGETNPKYTCECVRVRARVLSWGRLGNSQSVVYCTDLNLSSPSFFYLLHRFFLIKSSPGNHMVILEKVAWISLMSALCFLTTNQWRS